MSGHVVPENFVRSVISYHYNIYIASAYRFNENIVAEEKNCPQRHQRDRVVQSNVIYDIIMNVWGAST